MKTTRLITAIACAAGALSPALAGDGYRKTVPQAESDVWMSVLVVAVAVLATAAVAFKNAKRTHLD